MCGPNTEVLNETPAETFLRLTGQTINDGCSYSKTALLLFKAFDIEYIYRDEAVNELQLNLLNLPV